MLATIPEVTGLNYKEALTGLHSIIIGWNYYISKLGVILSFIPYIPKLSSDLINSFALTIFIIPGFYKSLWTNYIFLRASKNSTPTGFILSFHFAVTYLFFLSVTFFVIYAFNSVPEMQPRLENMTEDERPKTSALYFAFSLVCLIAFIYVRSVAIQYRSSKGFRISIWFLFGVILSVEILFFLNGPGFARGWMEHSCAALEIPADECAPD